MLDITQKTALVRAILETRADRHLDCCQTAALGAVVLTLLTGADYIPRRGQLQLYCAPHCWGHLDRYAWIVRMNGDRVVEVVDLCASEYDRLARKVGLPQQRLPEVDFLWDSPEVAMSDGVALRYDECLTQPWLRSLYPPDVEFLDRVAAVLVAYPPLKERANEMRSN